MEIIPANQITIALICEFLENSNIPHWQEDADTVFIDGRGMEIWLTIDTRYRDLIFSSYHRFNEAADRLDKLAFTNRMNADLKQVQFSYDAVDDRLNGFYYLSFKDGLSHVMVMRAAARFAKIFNVAVPKEDREGLLDFECEPLTMN